MLFLPKGYGGKHEQSDGPEEGYEEEAGQDFVGEARGQEGEKGDQGFPVVRISRGWRTKRLAG
jgi:hypothetical protein